MVWDFSPIMVSSAYWGKERHWVWSYFILRTIQEIHVSPQWPLCVGVLLHMITVNILQMIETGSHSKSENILSVTFDVSYFIITLSTFWHKLIKTNNFLDNINVENYN